jgi:hypothetical protein
MNNIDHIEANCLVYAFLKSKGIGVMQDSFSAVYIDHPTRITISAYSNGDIDAVARKQNFHGNIYDPKSLPDLLVFVRKQIWP